MFAMSYVVLNFISTSFLLEGLGLSTARRPPSAMLNRRVGAPHTL